jgi:hypothetical protein
MEDLSGQIAGQRLSRETVGQAFGSFEYTYGLGL